MIRDSRTLNFAIGSTIGLRLTRSLIWCVMNYRKLALVLGCSLIASANAFAQSAYTPAPGSAERAAIMDALRAPAKKDLGRTVIFKVDELRVVGDWAFARVSPTLPNGEEIDYSKTKYRKQVESGAFDPQAETLLRRTVKGWDVVEWRFGATDVESLLWVQKYNLPKSLVQ